MSKKHGHRRKRRRRTAPGLLAGVARSLNACEDAGLPVRWHHGAVTTREGYVVQFSNGRWAPRTLTWTEFSPPDGSDGGWHT
jgi:hypothetical protein